ncbi:MAG: pyruvate ferredoxin oxidoreductase [Rhodospirillaceae bacterium]|jgi:2-oxoglutarate ferredoxin oxidoreductase subunit gamma|nr:pyruvate ferredoxin oxidoreductase [Rhodospirillaceae bacterium]MBT5039321.1 pyruvate ferredoxin oxidoreductase [Rhodospirillaceae bacterium]MBT5674503.1 pyruvate ferredoxin oxidoreductase [Rhodospirillaceae bacterium]MBT5779863.1 pyruvate ferredoxin oxidoreductase [Rhodospirillaceae bacterium]
MTPESTNANNNDRRHEIRFAGSGGQGLQLSAKILAYALIGEGLYASQSQSYEPTSRGGLSRADLVIGPDEPDFPLATAADFILLLDQVAANDGAKIIKPGGTIITDQRLVPSPPSGDFRLLALPITDTAIAIGNPRIANVVALGVLNALAALASREALEAAVGALTPAKFRELNLEALKAGYGMAEAETAESAA